MFDNTLKLHIFVCHVLLLLDSVYTVSSGPSSSLYYLGHFHNL